METTVVTTVVTTTVPTTTSKATTVTEATTTAVTTTTPMGTTRTEETTTLSTTTTPAQTTAMECYEPQEPLQEVTALTYEASFSQPTTITGIKLPANSFPTMTTVVFRIKRAEGDEWIIVPAQSTESGSGDFSGSGPGESESQGEVTFSLSDSAPTNLWLPSELGPVRAIEATFGDALNLGNEIKVYGCQGKSTTLWTSTRTTTVTTPSMEETTTVIEHSTSAPEESTIVKTTATPGGTTSVSELTTTLTQEATTATPKVTTTPACEENREWKCGCSTTCEDMANNPSCNNCVYACHCAEGYVLDDGECVREESCPCYYNGQFYQYGEEVILDDCYSATCGPTVIRLENSKVKSCNIDTCAEGMRLYDLQDGSCCRCVPECIDGREWREDPRERCERTCDSDTEVCNVEGRESPCYCSDNMVWNGTACADSCQCEHDGTWMEGNCTYCEYTDPISCIKSCHKNCTLECAADEEVEDVPDECCRCVPRERCIDPDVPNGYIELNEAWAISECKIAECIKIGTQYIIRETISSECVPGTTTPQFTSPTVPTTPVPETTTPQVTSSAVPTTTLSVTESTTAEGRTTTASTLPTEEVCQERCHVEVTCDSSIEDIPFPTDSDCKKITDLAANPDCACKAGYYKDTIENQEEFLANVGLVSNTKMCVKPLGETECTYCQYNGEEVRYGSYITIPGDCTKCQCIRNPETDARETSPYVLDCEPFEPENCQLSTTTTVSNVCDEECSCNVTCDERGQGASVSLNCSDNEDCRNCMCTDTLIRDYIWGTSLCLRMPICPECFFNNQVIQPGEKFTMGTCKDCVCDQMGPMGSLGGAVFCTTTCLLTEEDCSQNGLVLDNTEGKCCECREEVTTTTETITTKATTEHSTEGPTTTMTTTVTTVETTKLPVTTKLATTLAPTTSTHSVTTTEGPKVTSVTTRVSVSTAATPTSNVLTTVTERVTEEKMTTTPAPVTSPLPTTRARETSRIPSVTSPIPTTITTVPTTETVGKTTTISPTTKLFQSSTIVPSTVLTTTAAPAITTLPRPANPTEPKKQTKHIPTTTLGTTEGTVGVTTTAFTTPTPEVKTTTAVLTTPPTVKTTKTVETTFPRVETTPEIITTRGIPTTAATTRVFETTTLPSVGTTTVIPTTMTRRVTTTPMPTTTSVTTMPTTAATTIATTTRLTTPGICDEPLSDISDVSIVMTPVNEVGLVMWGNVWNVLNPTGQLPMSLMVTFSTPVTVSSVVIGDQRNSITGVTIRLQYRQSGQQSLNPVQRADGSLDFQLQTSGDSSSPWNVELPETMMQVTDIAEFWITVTALDNTANAVYFTFDFKGCIVGHTTTPTERITTIVTPTMTETTRVQEEETTKYSTFTPTTGEVMVPTTPATSMETTVVTTVVTTSVPTSTSKPTTVTEATTTAVTTTTPMGTTKTEETTTLSTTTPTQTAAMETTTLGQSGRSKSALYL
ncbi:uncharacterized protein [Diadema antillarum]|uniref:uncharacterized protein n=1 Tax=Diadema antillarum TaxID=105358 RepID=UPI003A87FD2B